MPDNILSELNPRQREAVETISGPLLIVAGPGSGKTRVITHRIAYLADKCGVEPYRIAALTFTNKAAREMRERAATLMRTRNDQVTMSTFHSFCARVLRRHGELLGLDKDYTIYDQSDQTSLVKRAMEELKINPKQFSPGTILSSISGAKSKLIGAEGYGLKKADYFEEIVHRVYERYEDLLTQSSALDFDDLILKTHTLLRQHSDVAESYRDRYVHIMVDEFQDTNIAQYEIAKQLTGEYRNLCVVGDPDQSIYSWRNADIRNILSFKKDFSDARTISLEENYRSTETILEAAQKVIAPNRQRLEQNLFTKLGRGVPIVVHESYDENDEAQFVISEIQSLKRTGKAWSDIAVMYRVNAQSRALEEMCLRYDVPYHLVGSIKFYQRQEVKDIIAYLRLIANHNDDVSFRRIVNVPTRGIGQRTMSELDRLAWGRGSSLYAAIDETAAMLERPGNYVAPLPARSIKALQDFKAMIDDLTDKNAEYEPSALIEAVLQRTGYGDHIESDAERSEERKENVRELQSVAKDLLDYGEDNPLTAFLERVSLVSDADNVGESPDAVTLITLHQAKGLEFPVVFIVGMEEGVMPHMRSIDSGDPAEIEEERRLCYVGVTRAKEKLHLVRAFRRGFRGRSGSAPAMPSRFLADIPQDLLAKPDLSPGRSRLSGQQSQPASRPPTTRADGPGERVVRQPDSPVIRRRRRDARAAPQNAGLALNTGDRVRHKTFGEGIVTEAKASRGDTEVTVAFKDGQGVKRLLLSFAPLEKVE
ncbi:MAG: UvrD-helicase domain-containing protein [Chloroflexi bacterium]|nr:UvrD-helicase domain-containing protein [Chloroflexota bacterium]